MKDVGVQQSIVHLLYTTQLWCLYKQGSIRKLIMAFSDRISLQQAPVEAICLLVMGERPALLFFMQPNVHTYLMGISVRK